MSKPAKRIAHDWRALLEDMREADPIWEDQYVHALQKSLEGRKHDALLALLDAKAPLHPHLLPVLASVIRSAQQPLMTGQGSALTAHQDNMVRGFFKMLTADKKHLSQKRRGITEAHDWLAKQFGVSTDTIKRSLKRTEAKK